MGLIQYHDVTINNLAPVAYRGRRPKGGKTHMNKYEVTVILSAKLEEEARTEVINKVKSYIERYNGTVGEVEEWGKKRLAYDIQHQSEGFYYLINFEGDSETPNGIESELRIYEPVLRYLVVKK